MYFSEEPIFTMIIELKKSALHNPDNLTEHLIGSSRGWRLLTTQELNTVPAYPKNDEALEIWDPRYKAWDVLADFHHHSNRTYRTKRPL